MNEGTERRAANDRPYGEDGLPRRCAPRNDGKGERPVLASELVALADELCANPFSSKFKAFLVNEIERQIHVQVLLEAPEDILALRVDTDAHASADMATQSLSVSGWDQGYLSWMLASYYWYMGEYDTYDNEKAMFDQRLAELVHTVAEREHRGCGASEYQ